MLNVILDILKVPAILVGLISLIGLLLQKKSASDTIKGTIKTILGFIIIGGGAGILVGALVLGFIMAFFPAIAQPTMRKIIGSDDVAFGHFGTVGYVLSAWVGSLVGKNSKSTEEMALPKNLSFLRDSSISISLTMSILYIIVAVTAGVYIILQGVRLLLAEIVPAFTGISQKLVPNAKPALDCPIVFPYAPNAVLIGFLSSFIGGIVGLLILGQLKMILILPGVVPHFFCGATAGVFGNATGGRKGATIGAFIHGLLITFLPVALLPILGSLGFANTTFSDADFGVVGIILGYIVGYF